jgi:hypothetical protein
MTKADIDNTLRMLQTFIIYKNLIYGRIVKWRLRPHFLHI